MRLVFYIYGVKEIIDTEPNNLLRDAVQQVLDKINETDKIKCFICSCGDKRLNLDLPIADILIKDFYGDDISIEKIPIYIIHQNRLSLLINQINPY
jgi:hypothetical protein